MDASLTALLLYSIHSMTNPVELIQIMASTSLQDFFIVIRFLYVELRMMITYGW